jgi:dihydrofolate synthase / folylpolyglutamate synthase
VKICGIKTPRISAGGTELLDLISTTVPAMPTNSVLAITSKIVSLCEGAVVPTEVDKETLIQAEADLYLSAEHSKWGVQFTITRDTLIPTAGIDESNSGDCYVLWPRDPQGTANAVRAHLIQRFGHDQLGVVITDSTCRPLRRGVSGIAIAFSGFKPLRDYVGEPDLFNRPFAVSQSDLVGGLAASAVLVMGEGTESTPMALLEDLTFIDFVPHNPSDAELAALRVDFEEDLFAPFFQAVNWLPGGRRKVKFIEAEDRR